MARPRCGVSDAPTETAFAIWAANSSLTFSRDTNKPDIIIAFREGRHTMLDRRYGGAVCPDDLDGPGKHIALTPNPQNSHHLLQTLVHEIGHSLGLSHTTDENSLMYAYSPAVDWPVVLGMEDVLAVRNLYDAAKDEPSTVVPAEPTVVQTTTTPATTTTASPEPPDPCT
ncbi:Interstitial collagenase [Ooceraea biroi]|uniref:Interstitial collagenase n=1 Tax=Ooceraea biroi TaxID=2015173 RepID=A0A026WCU8_OOCBI|nr:Interstitial collagenase [Ooceraea biroi]